MKREIKEMGNGGGEGGGNPEEKAHPHQPGSTNCCHSSPPEKGLEEKQTLLASEGGC